MYERVSVDAYYGGGGIECPPLFHPEQGGALNHKEGAKPLAPGKSSVSHGVAEASVGIRPAFVQQGPQVVLGAPGCGLKSLHKFHSRIT